MTRTTNLAGACALALAALLAGCGGGGEGDAGAGAGGGGDPVAGAGEVPASALVSVRAFADFTGMQKADERAEPLDVERAVPPTSETDEPVDVI